MEAAWKLHTICNVVVLANGETHVKCTRLKLHFQKRPF